MTKYKISHPYIWSKIIDPYSESAQNRHVIFGPMTKEKNPKMGKTLQRLFILFKIIYIIQEKKLKLPLQLINLMIPSQQNKKFKSTYLCLETSF